MVLRWLEWFGGIGLVALLVAGFALVRYSGAFWNRAGDQPAIKPLAIGLAAGAALLIAALGATLAVLRMS
jgi:hypothetical protein